MRGQGSGTLLGLLLCCSLPTAAVARDSVSFDFGWRHRTGLRAWAPPFEEPPEPKDADPGLRPAEAQVGYKDDDWLPVQLPHDALITTGPSEAACPDGCAGRSYIPRHVLWYRKEFTLPLEWQGSAIWLDFEGSFRLTKVWVNGELSASHDSGYTPFRVRLDNISSVHLGRTTVVAVFVDPDNGDEGGRSRGSGWWYEGGGLYRHVRLVRADQVHVEQDGLFAYSNLTWSVGSGEASAAALHASVAVANDGAPVADVCVSLHLFDSDGETVGSATVGPLSIEPGTSAGASATITVAAPKLWSAMSPYLYSLNATVRSHVGAGGSTCLEDALVLDSVQVPHGFRSLRHNAEQGFFLNEAHFKVRGFCDHNTFAIVGMAVPDRISLFRAQASRAIGGNGRRTSQSPPDVTVLDIYDRVGIVVMDENRLFANNTKYFANMAAMVKRDRNHPSVVMWSFCNEGGCQGWRETGGPEFREIAYTHDGSRPVLANMFQFDGPLTSFIDVQGFSHQPRKKFDACHAKLPQKPTYGSECCSCNTMRDEDEGCETLSDNPQTGCIQKAFNARCMESDDAVNASDGVEWVVGTMVWSLFDYYGEPSSRGWPEVSSTYGQFDLCGFPKAAAFWYRTQWLLTIPDGSDKTFPTLGRHEVQLVESWESPDSFPSTKGNRTRSIHAYTSAPQVELLVNGKSQGLRSVQRMVQGPGSYAEWKEVPWEPGQLKAVARDAGGAALAQAVRRTNSAPVRVALSLDAPSAATGTGSALVLDGQDAALVRASILDAEDNVVHLAAHNVSFRVVEGPGLLLGSHNGDPHSHKPSSAPWSLAYHGLARAVVRAAGTAARPEAERALLARIDRSGPMSAAGRAPHESDVAPILIEASSPGLAPSRLSIPVSTSAALDGVLAVAAAGAGKPVDFFSAGFASSRMTPSAQEWEGADRLYA